MKTAPPPPRAAAVIAAIGRVTRLEILRDRVLYNIGLFTALILGAGYLASRLTFLRPERVIIDFGFSAMNLSLSAVGILLGANLIGREIERRTISLALSRPITRAQFVLGKFWGLAQVLLLNWALLCACFVAVLGLSTESRFSALAWVHFQGFVLLFWQSLVLSALAIFLSTFSTASITTMMSVGFYLIGNNISQIRLLGSRLISSSARWAVDAGAAVLPNLEHFNLGTKVTYGLPVTWGFVGVGALYGACLAGILLALAGLVVRAREL